MIDLQHANLTQEQNEAVQKALADYLSPKLIAEYGAKGLPRDAHGRILPRFVANGNTYTILTAETGVGIERYTQFEKLAVSLGFHSFERLAGQIDEALKLVNQDADFAQRRIELTIHLSSIRRGISEMSEMKYNVGMYACTLFVVREGEDLTTYSQELAEEKIADWNAAGISERDFFLLSISGLKGFIESFQNLTKEAKRQNQRLLAIFKGKAKNQLTQ